MHSIYEDPGYFERSASLYEEYLGHLRNLLGENFFSGKVLDLGCGKGEMLKVLKSRYPKNDYYGLDISEYAVEQARKEVGLLVKKADLNLAFPFKSNTFDRIYSKSVIEHILNPDSFIKECFRVLKPGGRLVLSTPNLLSWQQRILCVFGYIPTFYELSTIEKSIGLGLIGKIAPGKKPVGHIRVFNAIGLRDIFALHNFIEVKVYGASASVPLTYGLNQIYKAFDSIASRIPGLASTLILYAEKPYLKNKK